jgi:hypothetical protein
MEQRRVFREKNYATWSNQRKSSPDNFYLPLKFSFLTQKHGKIVLILTLDTCFFSLVTPAFVIMC